MSLVGRPEMSCNFQPTPMRTAQPARRFEFRRRLAKIEAATTIAWAMSPLIVAAVVAVS